MPVSDSQRAAPVVGSHYLELRARLGTALFALEATAVETRVAPARREELPAWQARLREPLTLLVIGETKAGKSALCNALFGCALCPTGAAPITKTVEVFRYGEPARDLQVAPGVTECHRPLRFLRDFHVVDTPGSDSTVAENWIVAENYAPRADVILVVFNTVRPWGETPWNVLGRLPGSALDQVLCVLQQADLRAEREIAAVRDHLRQTALRRLGRTFPIFPVSAKKAFLARTTGVDKDRLWEESRFEPFEKQVSQAITGHATRREQLRIALRDAQRLLGEIQSAENLRRDRARLAHLRDVVAELGNRTREQIATYLDGCAAACERIAQAGARDLREQLRPAATLQLVFTRQRGWLEAFGKKMEGALRTAVATEIERLVGQLENHLRLVWRQMHEQFRIGVRQSRQAASSSGGAVGSGVLDRQRAQLFGEAQLVILGHQAEGQIQRQLEDLFADLSSSPAAAEGGSGGLTERISFDAPGRPTDDAAATAGGGSGLPAQILARLDSLGVFDCRDLVAQLNAAPVFGSRRVTVETFVAGMTKKREAISSALAGLLEPAGATLERNLASLIAPLETLFDSPDEPRRLLLERLEALESNLHAIASQV